MKALINRNPRDLRQAVTFAEQARANGSQAMIAGGGSDLLGMVKDRIVAPDVLIHLRGIKGLDQVTAADGAVNIGGLITLDALSHHPLILRDYAVLAEAAGSVATPQIRNAGTLAGNVCQRPWCWYFRNGFPCFKAGGNTCFSITGENQFHAIFGGGPSFHRPSVGHRARAGGAGREVPYRWAEGRANDPSGGVLYLAEAKCGTRERARRR